MILNTLKCIYNQLSAYWNPPNYVPSILSHYNILSIVDIHPKFYVMYNLSLGTYKYGTPVFTSANMYKFTYIYRFTPYNCPFQSSWGSEIILNTEYSKIYNLWCYKISNSYWFHVQDDLYSVQTACFPTEPYAFSLYNPLAFTFGVPTVQGEVSQCTDNYQNNIDLLEIRTILNLNNGKTGIEAVSQSAPVKSINPRFKEAAGNKVQNVNDSLTLKTNNLKYTLDNFDLGLKIFGDTTELPFIPEFYNWFIFLFHYMLLFTFSLLFLFPPKNFKFINPNSNINHQVLWPKKYPQLITKVYKCWINYLFKRWRYR
jgi:hypothetical protein